MLTVLLFIVVSNIPLAQESLGIYELLAMPDSVREERIQHLENYLVSRSPDTVYLAAATLKLGQDYAELGFTDKALEKLNESLKYHQHLNDSAGICTVFRNISFTYSRVQDYERALNTLLSAERFSIGLEERKEINASFGYIYFNLTELDSAEKYLRLAASQYRQTGQIPTGALLNLSGVNVSRGNYREALKGLLELERMGLSNMVPTSRFYVLHFIAALYQKTGNAAMSRKYLDKTDSLRKKEGPVTNSLDFYETIASADTLMGNYQRAVRNQQKYIELYKSYNKNNLSTQLANYQRLFELKEKESALGLLEKENQLILLRQEKSRFYLIIAILGIVVLLLVIILIYRSLIQRTLMNKRLTQLNEQIVHQKEDLNEQNQLLQKTIGDLKQTQDKLIQSEKLASIGVFVSGVAHELNNPINVVSGGLYVIERNVSELLSGELAGDRHLLNDLEVMLKESGKSISKINKIIQALCMATYTDTNPVKMDIAQIIDNVLLGLNLYEFRDVDFEKDTPSVVVECFPNRIHHALKSVLENAFYYCRLSVQTKKWVAISCEKKEQTLKISIRNNGPAIAQQDLVKIFDPFFTTRDDSLSPGLGLYFAFSAISEHRGTIEAFNAESGVVFEVTLPLDMATSLTAETIP